MAEGATEVLEVIAETGTEGELDISAKSRAGKEE